MNEVQRIKQRHDMDILLRAIAPAAQEAPGGPAPKRDGEEPDQCRLGPPGAFLCAWYEGGGVSLLPLLWKAGECLLPATTGEEIPLPPVCRGTLVHDEGGTGP